MFTFLNWNGFVFKLDVQSEIRINSDKNLPAQTLLIRGQGISFLIRHFGVVWTKLMEIKCINPKDFEAVVNPVSDIMSMPTTRSGV